MLDTTKRFQLSPLIRFTLLTVYFALVLPLPLMAPLALRPWLEIAVVLGFGLVWALLSEQVVITESGLAVGYPNWCNWLLRRSWALKWEEIRALVPVGTSQGGTVYYMSTHDQRHQLLPQRLESFPEFLSLVKHYSGLDTSTIGRLTPPWTYQLLAGLAGLMLLGESSMALAINQGWLAMPVGGPG